MSMSKFVKSRVKNNMAKNMMDMYRRIANENIADEYNKALDELIEESTKQVNNINNWKKITKEKQNGNNSSNKFNK